MTLMRKLRLTTRLIKASDVKPMRAPDHRAPRRFGVRRPAALVRATVPLRDPAPSRRRAL